MDEKFQDKIDNYLLDRMDDAEKESFWHEVEQDDERKEQLEFTRNVKDSIRSREEKMRVLTLFQRQYEEERKVRAMRATGTDSACYCPAPRVVAIEPVRPKKRVWLWISGVAAVFVVGFFAINPMFVYDSSPNDTKSMEQIRGEKDVFDGSVFVDSMDNDTIKFNTEKKVAPNE